MTDIRTIKSKYGAVTIELEGFGTLQDKLYALSKKDYSKVQRNALSAGGGTFKDFMVFLCPKDTGWLKKHFRVTGVYFDKARHLASVWMGPRLERDFRGRGAARKRKEFKQHGLKPTAAAGAKSPALIARELEFGTSRMGAKPFMRPAIRMARESALRRIIDKLKSMVEEMASGR